MSRCAVPAALLLVGLVAACGSGTTAPTARPTPKPTPRHTPVPGPDTETVSITATGIGAYDLAAIPVAVVHNDAARHGAEQVVVHFQTQSAGGGTLGALDSVPVNIAPGETLPVTADCTDACAGAARASATATVSAWVSVVGVTVQASAAAYGCEAGCSGHGHGDVTGTLSARLGSGAAVAVFAACRDASGTVVGGGSQEVVWPGSGTFAADIPVIVSATPATCSLGASTGW